MNVTKNSPYSYTIEADNVDIYLIKVALSDNIVNIEKTIETGRKFEACKDTEAILIELKERYEKVLKSITDNE